LPRLDLNLNPPNACLLSIWDYSYESLHLASGPDDILYLLHLNILRDIISALYIFVPLIVVVIANIYISQMIEDQALLLKEFIHSRKWNIAIFNETRPF
jgi:hypothetical protein